MGVPSVLTLLRGTIPRLALNPRLSGPTLGHVGVCSRRGTPEAKDESSGPGSVVACLPTETRSYRVNRDDRVTVIISTTTTRRRSNPLVHVPEGRAPTPYKDSNLRSVARESLPAKVQGVLRGGPVTAGGHTTPEWKSGLTETSRRSG